MGDFLLVFFIFLLILLNVACYKLYKKGKIALFLVGIIILLVAPVLGFISGSLFYTTGGGQGAGFGGAFLGLLTVINGLIIILISVVRWIIISITSKQK
ncbi:inner-membrane translocator [Ornithinibacillus sp. L9]|uniref:Inner-membrane translocator n=1 Tax=Ornithinibacillus caprae TaxID=2678566 RepID=A0A6N8FPS4_9BACI|nr:inner-membrane translocator [Ornithinibacillus caprae]MUK89498.1 inner-membrane translocator [Ornithinibacillus caprae]